MAEDLCPLWVGYLLANPLRKLFQNPAKILGPHVAEGMTALDLGCAMGFFSLPLAAMVGADGKVICVDVQEKMLRSLEKRARKAKLSERIETRLAGPNTLGLDDIGEKFDFALAFAVVHEVPNPDSFFTEVHDAIRPGAKFLVSEPKGHISASAFEATVNLAEKKGFGVVDRSRTFSTGYTVLLQK